MYVCTWVGRNPCLSQATTLTCLPTSARYPALTWWRSHAKKKLTQPPPPAPPRPNPTQPARVMFVDNTIQLTREQERIAMKAAECHHLRAAVLFVEELQQAGAWLEDLLGSTTVSDVVEALRYFVTVGVPLCVGGRQGRRTGGSSVRALFSFPSSAPPSGVFLSEPPMVLPRTPPRTSGTDSFRRDCWRGEAKRGRGLWYVGLSEAGRG